MQNPLSGIPNITKQSTTLEQAEVWYKKQMFISFYHVPN